MSARKLALLSLVIAVGVFAPVAHSSDARVTAPLYAKMKQRFTTTEPGASTGWIFSGALKPTPAGQQVPPQVAGRFVFPPGTRTDLSHVVSCEASDEEIVATGLSACPPESQNGTGEATLFLGEAGYLDVEAHSFVARPGFALVFTTASGAVLRVIRATVAGNRLSVPIPSLPLPGGYRSAVVRFALEAEPLGTAKHPALRTPKTCPESGRWKFVYLPQYEAPYGVQRSTSTTPCRED